MSGGGFFCIGECWACGAVFTFNPHLVPSIPINDVRQPVCGACVERANVERRENGRPLIEVLPGAYDTPAADL